MLEHLNQWIQIPALKAAAIVLGSLVAAFIVEVVFTRVLLVIVRRTKTTTDDKIVGALKRPIYFSVLLVGLAWAVRALGLSQQAVFLVDAVLKTIAVLIWTTTLLRISSLVFKALAARATETSLVQTRTQPVFDIFSKLAVIAAASYFMLLAWNINVGAWLASAGIAGIALGFAAKDTLSNLFAGIFIVADAPYKVGDFILLETGIRGRVTSIGFRSTRLLTLDDIEITIPNGVLGNSQIINESGGPYRKARVRVTVEAAYGSDIDAVREALLGCAAGAEHVCDAPAPQVRFAEFGASGLVHHLLVWIERPFYRETVTDALNSRVYKAFAEASIEIPYAKHDVYIKEFRGSFAA